MVWYGLAGKALPALVTGVVGAAAYEALAKAPWRTMTVPRGGTAAHNTKLGYDPRTPAQ